MNFIDNFIQSLFDTIDHLFWFNTDNGPKKMKKLNVMIASLLLITFFCIIYQLIR